jgi:hypothetical protein
VDSPGSGYGPLAGCCEWGDEPSGSGATELLLHLFDYTFRCLSASSSGHKHFAPFSYLNCPFLLLHTILRLSKIFIF